MNGQCKIKINLEDLRADVDALLREGYDLWDENGLPPLEYSERYAAVDAAGAVYDGFHRKAFAAACQSFFLFRKLHLQSELLPEVSTLLGDYFFSQFSKHMIPIDSVPLIDAFSDYLAQDVAGTSGDYLDFIAKVRVAI
ncbi:MAG: hypothetical protein LBN36_00595 [Clostridiales Family XIII bacterium]|jgi:hypothetical protein|nr:hypothetical protein [Clostridiales Family XIII bacterium]